MDVSEIVDQKSIEAWLRALPEERRRESAVALATRAALRAFPYWAAEMPTEWARKDDMTALPLSRGLLISAVAVKMPTPDNREAAAFAASAISAVSVAFPASAAPASHAAASARASARASAASASRAAAASPASAASASHAAFAARASAARATPASSATSTTRATDAFWAVLREDCRAVQTGEDIRHCSLWLEEMRPEKLSQAWTTGRAWMEAVPGHAFWIRWYEAILAGRPLTGDWDSHWQLMHDLSQIDPKDWGEGKEQDAIRVAGVIAKIEKRYAKPSGDRPVDAAAQKDADRDSSMSPIDLIDRVSRDEVKATLARNKMVLPANLDAMASLTELEIVRIERLRGDNSLSEELREELKSLGERLQSLFDALERMKERVEGREDGPSEEDAEAAKSLIKHFIELGQKWPRENSKELVDRGWHNALGAAGNTFRLGGMFGAYSLMTLAMPLAPELAAGIAGTLFGAEKVASTLGKRFGKDS